MRFKNIASFIKESRLAVGMSQSDLSYALGYKNGQFISNVERAKCGIPAKKMKKVRDILKVSEDDLKQVMMNDYQGYLESNLD